MGKKVATVAQLLENARQAEALTMQVAEAAAASIEQQNEEISNLKTSVSDGKSAIAGAITDMGVSTSPTADFPTMENNIRAIQTGTDTSDATAVAGDILSGKTAYVDGKKVTGTIISQAAATITPGTTAKTAVAAKRYTTGAVKVAGDTNLKAANIKSGVTIFGVTGNYEAPSATSGIPVSISPANSIKSYSVVYASSASELSGELDATTAKTLTTYGALVIAVQKQSGTTASLNASVSGGVSALITTQSCVILPTSSNVNVTIS